MTEPAQTYIVFCKTAGWVKHKTIILFLIIILLLLLLFVLSQHIFNPITLYVINKSVFSLLNELRKNAYKQVGNDYIVIFLFCKYCWNSLYMEIVLGVSKLGVI
ncbi:hypothetical protein FOCC_FOCC009646 [Frankliniella occidentalis]|nr:hypothetical protein FOCC_FOCC009646 [Frankliniella occidentalis]